MKFLGYVVWNEDRDEFLGIWSADFLFKAWARSPGAGFLFDDVLACERVARRVFGKLGEVWESESHYLVTSRVV